MPVTDFEAAIEQAEKRLGLVGQPRAIVFHEKNGRRHAHAVWSRIDGQELKAIHLPHYKRKLAGMAQELFLEHEWEVPRGFEDSAKRDPLTYNRQEAEQAKRAQRDPKALKALFRECWEASDSKTGFEAALREQGFVLARGDRRGFVAVDGTGKIWSLSRWCGVKPKEMRARLGPETGLPTVDEVADLLRNLPRQPAEPSNAAFDARRSKLVETQRKERATLLKRQEEQRIADVKKRHASLPKGLRGVLSRATGQYQAKLDRLKAEAKAAQQRDREEQQSLIAKHLNERRALTQEGQRQGLSTAFLSKATADPKQTLVLRDKGLPYSSAQLTQSPELVLDHVSQTKAAFKRVDVLRALAKRLDDPLTLQTAADLAMRSPSLVRLPNDGTTHVFTTKDYVQAEQAMERAAQAMSAKGGLAVEGSHIVHAIKRQKAQMQKSFGGSLSEEQRNALHHVLGNGQLCSVVGLAGAGKSTLLNNAPEAWAKQGFTVHGAALAGKAAEELQSASGIKSRTLASLELSRENGHAPISKGDVLIVDEAGMIGTRQMARVAAKLNEIGAKLVLVGDPDQLQPIEAGTPFRQIVKSHGAAALTEIHRQREDWQKRASRNLANGDMGSALDQYQKGGAVSRSDDQQSTLEALVETYAMDVAANGTSKSRLAFAHKRKDVHALNQAMRAALRSDSDTHPETMFATDTGQRAFANDDRIVFTRNDKDIGVKNGMLGTVVSAAGNQMRVALDGDTGRLVAFNPHDFRSFDHGYAVTIRKSQGETVDHSYVLASRTMDRHLSYVAMTRHRENMALFVNERDCPIWARDQRHRGVQQRQIRSRDGPSIG